MSGRQMAAVVYKLRNRNPEMVEAWQHVFSKYPQRVQISLGDIFKEAPAADALVSPANSFGFMDGGIDGVYSKHFGWQLQERLQTLIRKEHGGELLVVSCEGHSSRYGGGAKLCCGNAAILPTFEGGANTDSMTWVGFNEDTPIKFLISAPTMRVPLEIPETVNAYLAFRAVILAVKRHNESEKADPITSVLCPGLGTAVGKMPFRRCAYQMLRAFEFYEMGMHQHICFPNHLEDVWRDHIDMTEYGTNKADERH